MTNFAPCPKCQNTLAEKVNFTWWGGVLGPRILSQVKCQKCGAKYNGKTGKDSTAGIIIYTLVVGGFVFVLIFVIAFLAVFIR